MFCLSMERVCMRTRLHEICVPASGRKSGPSLSRSLSFAHLQSLSLQRMHQLQQRALHRRGQRRRGALHGSDRGGSWAGGCAGEGTVVLLRSHGGGGEGIRLSLDRCKRALWHRAATGRVTCQTRCLHHHGGVASAAQLENLPSHLQQVHLRRRVVGSSRLREDRQHSKFGITVRRVSGWAVNVLVAVTVLQPETERRVCVCVCNGPVGLC